MSYTVHTRAGVRLGGPFESEGWAIDFAYQTLTARDVGDKLLVMRHLNPPQNCWSFVDQT